MPASHVLTRHDDGSWYVAQLLGQYRQPDGSWRCGGRYTVGLGMTYQRGVWADELRPVDDAERLVATTIAAPEQVFAWVVRARGAR
jgi:hypothetical protein